jgi:transposase
MQKYHVKLTGEDQKGIAKYLRSKKHNEQSKKRLRILLDLEESGGPRRFTTKKIAARQGTSEATILEVCRRYERGGWKEVANRKERETPAIASKVTGEIQAHIIATACSDPPAGKSRWSMKMIADKIVVDGIVDSICDETVRRVLKKRNSSPT